MAIQCRANNLGTQSKNLRDSGVFLYATFALVERILVKMD